MKPKHLFFSLADCEIEIDNGCRNMAFVIVKQQLVTNSFIWRVCPGVKFFLVVFALWSISKCGKIGAFCNGTVFSFCQNKPKNLVVYWRKHVWNKNAKKRTKKNYGKNYRHVRTRCWHSTHTYGPLLYYSCIDTNTYTHNALQSIFSV